MVHRDKIKLLLLIFTFLLFLLSSNSLAQETENTGDRVRSIIVLNDGSHLYGTVINRTSEKIVIYSDILGTTTIFLSDIKEIKDVSAKGWFVNPTDTRLFFAPTARSIKPGKGYFQDVYVFIASANYGLTDNFSIGGMVSMMPGLEITKQIFAFTPKYSMEVYENTNVALGGLYAYGSDSIGHMGIGYGIATYGNADTNVSIGAGYGLFTNPESEKNSSAIIGVFGGMHRVTEYISLITENWFIRVPDGNIILPSAGARFFGETLSADLGFIVPITYFNNQPFLIIPYLDFVYSF